MTSVIHLASASVSVVVDVATGIPVILHWGAPLDDVDVPAAWSPALLTYGTIDVVAPISVLPMHGDGFPGRPGLQGHRRGGRHWSPRFAAVGSAVSPHDGFTSLTCEAVDEVAQLAIFTTLTMHSDGVLTVDARLHNRGDSPYMLDSFCLSLPLPTNASELGVFAGRWSREFSLARMEWPWGAWTSENRLGRTSHEHPPYVFAFERGAGEWVGSVWGVHAAHSGNGVMYAERLADERRHISGGELLHPGEMCVYPGEHIDAVQLIGVHSDAGLTPASWGFHREARRRYPRKRTARPVQLNTWEAVYFSHDMTKLMALADAASEAGIERFVLDDGWFGGRRNDRAGLGDWVVSPDVYPDGLTPLIAHVRGLGMGFGIWVEPEMVNPDSDVFRAHPEWALVTEGYEPVRGRAQLVLDLANDGAYEHVLSQLDALLRDHDIEYVKWDMNRWHVQGSGADGKAGTHAQTRAFHRLLDELRQRHPRVEFESCASGGGRIDHEVLRRVERVWTSDSNDALERQLIQRGASMVIPSEVMGAHVGPDVSHTSGRRHSMAFRCITAMFGHMGVEADITKLDDRSRETLREWIGIHRRFRVLIHSGDSVRFDVHEVARGSALAHGVYAADRSEALLAYVRLATAESLVPPVWRIPGLDADATYRIEFVGGDIVGSVRNLPDWLAAGRRGDPISRTGRFLAEVGLQPPSLWPESGLVIRLVA